MTGMTRHSDFAALTFDCYGTLIDWESGLLAVLRPWTARHALDLTDDALLAAFARAESQAETASPGALYPDILRTVHRAIARSFGVEPATSDADELAASVKLWPPFPDTIDALRQLQRQHKLVIVSNVDRDSFAATSAMLGVRFDAVITAQDVGAYKPNPAHFRRAIAVLGSMGVEPSRILHVAQSLHHDHIPAKAMGFATAWVDRRRGKPGPGATPLTAADVEPGIVAVSLMELIDLLA